MIVVCEAEFCEPRGAKKLGTDSIKTFAGAGDQGLVRRLIKMMVLFVVVKIQVNIPLYLLVLLQAWDF